LIRYHLGVIHKFVEGKTADQVYSYPCRRWRKKKRLPPPVNVIKEMDVGEIIPQELIESAVTDIDPVVSLPKPAADNSKDKWYVPSSTLLFDTMYHNLSLPDILRFLDLDLIKLVCCEKACLTSIPPSWFNLKLSIG